MNFIRNVSILGYCPIDDVLCDITVIRALITTGTPVTGTGRGIATNFSQSFRNSGSISAIVSGSTPSGSGRCCCSWQAGHVTSSFLAEEATATTTRTRRNSREARRVLLRRLITLTTPSSSIVVLHLQMPILLTSGSTDQYSITGYSTSIPG
ncbi:hypothetical protein NECAME_17279 [Necator americanus]|uniref:Uncharacterized protein n=1 Tax=Necator americanus TaxID=51031 RepID=W2TPM1_NECAM|nr:hypothetical protein NECAME_17279 [Necator americanus]ETN84030.1 hypothetical protein NECAME_17279 [Necator americanus]